GWVPDLVSWETLDISIRFTRPCRVRARTVRCSYFFVLVRAWVPWEEEPSASRSSESAETSMVPGSCRVQDTTMYASTPGSGLTSPTFPQAVRSAAREASRP